MRMLDVFPAGERILLGTRQFSSDDILRFARTYDPQPFHTDPEAARNFVFGALCASGWHTSSSWMRVFYGYWTRKCAEISASGGTPPVLGPSPGFKDMVWGKPVFAGDEVTYFLTASETRRLNSRPGWRLNTSIAEGENQKGESVLRFTSMVLEQESDDERA
ncbi:MaoC/PaaZ C-terminal domain-containing protein [Rhizobium paknamense]|uniref:Acyl dehydratase n=1 Tax=Rhizobium paknamense TaxID=1206817 RepID=A0ABU0I8E1_9HYPH|nr:MaoC/PaaZ C-terminal domain-containing protein [Rhizobium paknamense]MDQ0454502.1 acyl dehydratase [Rhizobium paknamense]